MEVQIGGKKRPVLLDFNTLCEFEEETGKTAVEVLNSFNKISDIRTMFFIALKEGAIDAGQEVDFTIRDVGKWLGQEEDVISKLSKIVEKSFPQSKNPKAPEAGQG